MWVGPEAYPRIKHLKTVSLVYAPALQTNIRLIEMHATDKRSSLFWKLINYGGKALLHLCPGVEVINIF